MIRDQEDFHRYTRGRFVQDEESQQARRYVHFKVDALARVAASALGSKKCIDIQKCADGMYNKALMLTMDDGRQAIAKLPNPNAGLAHFTTASEVATMSFMRETLSIPVPAVYAWCSHAEQTPVEAEYIIMEKAAGVPLNTMWASMDLKSRSGILKSLVRFQSAWSSVDYPGCGSIYFAPDLPPDKRLMLSNSGGQADQSTSSSFALGTITGREWSDDGRGAVTLDRGPWRTAGAYFEALGQRELRCVNESKELPVPHLTLCGPGTYQPTREKKIRAIQMYNTILPALLPQDQAITRPTAWHPDLHEENIFVDPSNPTKITSLIDWQSTEVTPHCFQARQPYILDYDGPQAVGLDEPKLVDDFKALTPEEKQAATHLYFSQALSVAYRRLIEARLPDVWRSFEFQRSHESLLLVIARALFVDGEALYAARVLELLQSSSSADGAALRSTGLEISDAEAEEIETDADRALRGMEAMRALKQELGVLFPEKGCVRLEDYDAIMEALRECKELIINQFAKTDADRAAWQKSWPFDD